MWAPPPRDGAGGVTDTTPHTDMKTVRYCFVILVDFRCVKYYSLCVICLFLWNLFYCRYDTEVQSLFVFLYVSQPAYLTRSQLPVERRGESLWLMNRMTGWNKKFFGLLLFCLSIQTHKHLFHALHLVNVPFKGFHIFTFIQRAWRNTLHDKDIRQRKWRIQI